MGAPIEEQTLHESGLDQLSEAPASLSDADLLLGLQSAAVGTALALRTVGGALAPPPVWSTLSALSEHIQSTTNLSWSL